MKQDKSLFLQSLRAYIPAFVVEQQQQTPGTVGPESHIEAALLFADVSGFTPMSEQLAQLGKEGAEELTRVLNDYFETMIDLVREHGGQIIKFGGDAMTCAFTTPAAATTESLTLNLLRACVCGLTMQQRMDEFQAVQTRGGVFELKMKIGISAGSVLFLNVGDVAIGLEYVLAGHALDRMSEAEHHATVGEVIVDTQPFVNLSASMTDLGLVIAEKRDEFILLDRLNQPVPLTPLTDPNWTTLPDALAEQLAVGFKPYVPPTIYQRLVHGQPQFVGEHRRVVSLFVNFGGLNYDHDSAAGDKLNRYFKAVQRIVQQYGGRLNRVSTGDKGNMLHLIFGAPVAYEDIERRAVGAALAMQQLPHTSELAFINHQKIGLTSGYVFAGNVGSPQRREYTVMGDIVNLSARLMQACPSDSVLMDLETAQQVEDAFRYETLPPIKVKGKTQPIPIARPIQAKREAKRWGGEAASTPQQRTPMVGRTAELEQLNQLIAQVTAGQGQVVAIRGEAGVGKSRLLQELISLLRGRSMLGFGGHCLSYGAQSPYLPWIDLLTTLFGLQASHDSAEKLWLIEQRLHDVEAELVDWLPLIGQMMGLAVADNDLTTGLEAQLRKQRLFDLVLSLLRYQAEQVPLLLLVFEDVHWIDSISLEMLTYIARNIHDEPILLTVLYRPSIDLPEWTRFDHFQAIDLLDISAADALQLMQYKLGLTEIPPTLQQQVIRGQERLNPFFVEEVINTLVDKGYFVRTEEGHFQLVQDLTDVDLPDSVQALVMSRIDRLDESCKLTVKVASVIGRTFKYLSLNKIYPVSIEDVELKDNLTRLSHLDLTPLDRADELEYIFKHIITQEVAYESLLYAHRRSLHEQVAHYYEQTYPENLAEYYDLLAHHYTASDNQEKSWHYLIKAGHRAKEQYANEAALNYYQQALALPLNRPDAYQIQLSMGDIYRLIGQYEPALAAYQTVLDDDTLTLTEIARTRRHIAKTWELQGKYDEALAYLQETQSMLDSQTDAVELAYLYNAMAWIANQRGNYKEALAWCQTGLELAQKLPVDLSSQQVVDTLKHTLASIYGRKGDYAEAIIYFNECIALRQSLGDLDGMGRSHNNLAVVYWNQGNYDLAAEAMGKSLELAHKIGDVHGLGDAYNNLGVIYYTREMHSIAVAHYEKSLALRQRIGDLPGIAFSYINLGEVYYPLEDYEQAGYYLEKAAQILHDLNNKEKLSHTYQLLAEVELAQHNLDVALSHGQHALSLAQTIGNREYEGMAERVLGQIEQAAQQPEAALTHFRTSVTILSDTGNKLEMGKSYCQLGLALVKVEPVEAKTYLQQAHDIFDTLGVKGERQKAAAGLAEIESSE